ncbi:MAG: phospholipase A [Desulfopila sp.]|nr:phospholipase A [Desulfopila sp.]
MSGQQMRGCHSIAKPQERLACYDTISGREMTIKEDVEKHGRLALTEEAEPAAERVAEGAVPVYEEVVVPSMIDAMWGADPRSSRWLVTTHRRNYLLFARYSTDQNVAPYSPFYNETADSSRSDAVESKFQVSFKTRIWASEDRRFGAWLAYTQQSHWQVYNEEDSRPFRETNYMPELIVSYRPAIHIAGFDWNLFSAGYVHQSNGSSGLYSRSWDRLFAEFGFELDNFGVFLRAWYRIPENRDDENPDITDYYGHASLTALYRWQGHGVSLSARGNLRTGKGSVELSWLTPPLIGPLRGYVQLFSGYGESMIDYNWSQNTLGIGLALNDLY